MDTLSEKLQAAEERESACGALLREPQRYYELMYNNQASNHSLLHKEKPGTDREFKDL